MEKKEIGRIRKIDFHLSYLSSICKNNAYILQTSSTIHKWLIVELQSIYYNLYITIYILQSPYFICLHTNMKLVQIVINFLNKCFQWMYSTTNIPVQCNISPQCHMICWDSQFTDRKKILKGNYCLCRGSQILDMDLFTVINWNHCDENIQSKLKWKCTRKTGVFPLIKMILYIGIITHVHFILYYYSST